jgi:hypothetical protein
MSVYLGKDSVNVAMFARMQNEGEYTTRTTAGGEEILDGKLASVKKIQGDTVKRATLIPLPYVYGKSYESSGITYTVDTDGVITANGTATNSSVYMIEKNRVVFDKTKKLVISGCKGGSNSTYRFVLQFYKGSTFITSRLQTNEPIIVDLATIDFDNVSFYIQGLSGATLNNVKFYPMVEYGETASAFQPYFTDLKHAFIDSIKSTGRNIVNFDEIALNAVEKSSNSEIVTFDGKRCLKYFDIGNVSVKTVFPSGLVHGLRFKAYVDGNWFTSFASCGLSNGTTQYFGISESGGNKWVEFSRYFNDDRTIESFTFYAYNYQNNAPVYIDLDSVMFEQSGTPTEYDAYKESIYELPVPVQLGKWDYIDVNEAKKYTQTKTYVFNGTEDWRSVGTWTDEKKRYYLQVTDNLDKQTNMSVVPELVCNYYETVSPANCYGNQSDGIDTGASMQNGYQILIYDEVYSAGDVAVWKARLAELYASGKPLTISAKLETATGEDLDEIPKTYIAWNGGTETIEQGETDNSVYGAMPTITATYLKEYFNGGIQ